MEKTKKVSFNARILEERVEEKLENACSYHACYMWKDALRCYDEAMLYLDILQDDIGIGYDDCIINDHVQRMIDILEKDTKFVVNAEVTCK